LKKFKAAAIQMASGPNVAANLTEVGRLIDSAAMQSVQLVVLPENFSLMPMDEAQRIEEAEDYGSGPAQEFIAARAREYKIWIVAGTIGIRSRSADRIRSSSIVYDDQGKDVARYDKIHLFDVKLGTGEVYAESRIFEPGNEVVVVDTPFGNLGLAICYDLRFPELFRAMLDRDVELFALPSAFTARTGKAHWEVLVRARAIENLAYVIAAGQGGYHVNGRDTHGDSMIVGPWGDIHDRLPRGSGMVVAEIDRDQQASLRSSLPCIHHRQPDL